MPFDVTALDDGLSVHATICICTRERGGSILRTLRSLDTLEYEDFDVVIVDQSTSDDTYIALRPLICGNPRYTYIRSTSKGSAAAHNIAIDNATGPLLAFTDDDCEVTPGWLTALVGHFERCPEAGVVFGEVRPGPHDPEQGFIPTHAVSSVQRVHSRWLKWREHGIGANMAMWRELALAVGLFDEVLGTGAPLRAHLDGDIAYRMLQAGFLVLCVPDACVIHHGFRNWDQGSRLMRSVGIGIAATYMKYLRLGDLAVLPTLLIEWVRCISWKRLLTLRKRTGLRRFLAYGRGLVLSFAYRIDRRTRTYVSKASSGHYLVLWDTSSAQSRAPEHTPAHDGQVRSVRYIAEARKRRSTG